MNNNNQTQLLNTAKSLNSEYRTLLKKYSHDFIKEQKDLITSFQPKIRAMSNNINSRIKASGAFEDLTISIKPDNFIIQPETLAQSELIKSEQKSKQLSNPLMQHSSIKFWQGHKRTEESEYSIGNYKIERSENGKYNVRDANNELLISFEYRSTENSAYPKLILTSNSENPHVINQALKEFSKTQILSQGSPEAEKVYHKKITNILDQLSSYGNNFTVIRNTKSVISLQKNNEDITIRDENGDALIVANSQKINTSISSEKINSINQLLQSHSQQKQVEEIAPTLKKYLDLNETNRIDKDNLLVSFDPQTETIYYQDKKQPENKLSALLTQDGWKNIITNISPEKQEYFSQVVTPKIEQLTQQKHQLEQQQINRNSTKDRGRSR